MALTVKQTEKLSEPGRYGDGRRSGLYLHVGTGKGKSWLLRYERSGRERWMGLGSFAEFDLEEARERAREARQLLRDNIDPLEARKAKRDAAAKAAAKRLTFKEAAQQYYNDHEHEWTNAEHRRQFLSTLKEYAYPVIGSLSVDAIDTPLVLKVLKPIWITKRETADRVRSRIESVLGWAAASGYRSGDNCARWKGHLKEVLSGKGKVKHHLAMPYIQVPAFMASLASRESSEAKALEFLILTAARTSEVIKLRRSEINMDQKVWTVPPDRIKGRREHRVPLSSRAIALLKALPTEGNYIFPGARQGRPLGKMALANLIADRDDITVHGFRSSFRDWAGETTSFPSDICEVAMAHAVGGKTQVAYQRGDLLQKRAKLMEAWAQFCSSPSRDSSVVPIRRRG